MEINQTIYHSFLHSATDGMLLFSENLNLLDINHTGLYLLKSKPEIIGSHFFEIFPNLKKSPHFDELKAVLHSGKSYLIEDYNHFLESGAADLTLKAFKIEDGLGLLISDITNCKRTADELKQALIKVRDYESIINRSPVLKNFQNKSTHIQGILFDVTERKKAEESREQVIIELRKTLAKVKTLSGLLPICAACKKIRDDKGYWQQLEKYLHEHSEARFSQGLCPDCKKKFLKE